MAGSIREISNEMGDNHGNFDHFRLDSSLRIKTRTRRKIVEVILLNFRSNLGHKDKLEVI